MAAADRIVVMGVAASGKSTVAARLAERLGARLVEGDDHHLPGSIAKMRAGTPLTDADRRPWLDRLREELTRGPVIVSCSALRAAYRDVLRRAGPVRFVFLDVPPEAARQRIALRTGHFMGAEMLESQFATLERPEGEPDVLVVDATAPVDAIVQQVLDALRR